MKPSAIMIHVQNIEEGLAWYEKAFPNAKREHIDSFDFTLLKVDDFDLEIVRADEKVSSGKSGTVLYWCVADLKEALIRFQNLGATLYRGPLKIENGRGMCQLEDPFGNLIGLKGPYT